MGFMRVGEQTDPVPTGVCKQLCKGRKSLPERRMKEPDRWLRGGDGGSEAVFSPWGSRGPQRCGKLLLAGSFGLEKTPKPGSRGRRVWSNLM